MSQESLQSSPQWVTNQQTLSSSSSNLFDDHSQEKLLQENFKLSLKLQELEKQLFKEKSLHQFSSKNNTSASYELPSEFRIKWDNLVQDLLMDAFGDFFSDIKLVVPLVQFSLVATNAVIEGVMNNKMKTVLEVFNLQQQSDDHSNKAQIEELQNLLKPFLQNNYKEIFRDHTLFETFYGYYIKHIQEQHFYTDEELSHITSTLTANIPSLKEYFESLKNILVYMKINDPPITLDPLPLPPTSALISQMKLYRYYAECFYVIDGFDKEGKPCFMVLNQPKIGGGSFAGIKPSVIILEKLPEWADESELIDHKMTVKYSFEEVPEQKPSNLQTYTFKVQRNILYNTLNSEFPTTTQPQQQSPDIINKLSHRNSSSSLSDDLDKGEADDEDLLERDFNQTTKEIFSFLNEDQSVPLKKKTSGDGIGKVEKVEKGKDTEEEVMSMSLVSFEQKGHNQRHSSSNNFLQRTTEVRSTIQTTMFKRRQTQIVKDQQQRVTDNLALIDKSCNGSRYLQCSKFFLKSVVSQAEHRKQMREQSQQNPQLSRNSSSKDFQQDELMTLLNKSQIKIDHSKTKKSLNSTSTVRQQMSSQQQMRRDEKKTLNSTLDSRVSSHKFNLQSGQPSQRTAQRQKSPIQDKIMKQGSVLVRNQSQQKVSEKKQKSSMAQSQQQAQQQKPRPNRVTKLISPKAVVQSTFTTLKQPK